MSSNGHKSTIHHLIPRSRGGDSAKSNLKKLPWKVHDAWHTLFYNLLPEEICAHILVLPEELFNTVNKQLAWSIVFNCYWQEVQAGYHQELVLDAIVSQWLPRNYNISWEWINQEVWNICCSNCTASFCSLANCRGGISQQPFEQNQVFSYCYENISTSLVNKFFI